MLVDFRSWDVAKFPVSGKDLLAAGVPKGRGLGGCDGDGETVVDG